MDDRPRIRLDYLASDFDRLLARDALRKCTDIARTPAFRAISKGPVQAPALRQDGSIADHIADEELDEYVREHMFQGAHVMGTCRMAKSAAPDEAVHPPR